MDLRQLQPAVAVRGPHHRNDAADAVERLQPRFLPVDEELLILMYIVRLVLLALLTNVLQCGLRPLQCKGPGLFAPFSFR
jgi:hypothetical protein